MPLFTNYRTEKNATAWSKDKITSLFTDMEIQDDAYKVIIKSIDDITGEAFANNRKGKLIFFYEWEIKLEWEGWLRKTQKVCKGTITIPNLSEEHHDPEEVDVDVSLSVEDDEGYMVKEFLRVAGVKEVRTKIAIYISDLQIEYSKGLLLPSKDGKLPALEVKGGGRTIVSGAKKPEEEDEQTKRVRETKEKLKNLHSKSTEQFSKTRVTLSETFKCTADELYAALVVPEQVRAWTGSPAEIDGQSGGKFSMFSGNVEGTFLDLRPGSQIIQRWRFKDWPAGHTSMVTINIRETNDGTIMDVSQTSIPADQYDKTNDGWKRYYFQAIKARMGFGSLL
ncbi:PREDICTED: activator of 90 kDa heat shock protein ATPase homolog 1-like [Priapulus caudatus]|uniref:Activator of 90 kDa heat shock protein ATPase homolog 1-like n=1 Tax=Priapulus caudatus TaxID=37621 RepID=A0ABM1DW22_PRICU|nr:PREDICTED: activator of 90 kDa heat shock protein ATPase homolog 1-like [Priapulus caudatus]